MIVCGDFVSSTNYGIDQFEVLLCPTRSTGAANAGTHAEPLKIV